MIVILQRNVTQVIFSFLKIASLFGCSQLHSADLLMLLSHQLRARVGSWRLIGAASIQLSQSDASHDEKAFIRCKNTCAEEAVILP